MGVFISDEEQKEIVAKLQERGVKADKCPMCGNGKFIITDGYFNHQVLARNAIIANGGAIYIGGTSIPTVAITCTNCGFISQHSLGILGLLNQEKK